MDTHKPPGIIDSLATGFAIIMRRPYLILVPILVDLLVWRGPGISATPVLQQVGSWFLSAAGATGYASDPDTLLMINQQVSQTTETVGQRNLLGILGWQDPKFLGKGLVDLEGSYLALNAMWALFLMLLVLAVTGVLVGCLFLVPLGMLARGDSIDWPRMLRSLPGAWLRFTGYLAALVGLGVVIGLPVMVVVGLLAAFVPLLAPLLLLAVAGGVFLITIYLFLGDEAVIVGGARPLAAMKESYRIASRHFWSVLGLFLLVAVISQGLDLVWRRVATSTAGMWGGAVGNAFIATGLAASVMVYYWGRRPIAARGPLPQAADRGLGASGKDD